MGHKVDPVIHFIVWPKFKYSKRQEAFGKFFLTNPPSALAYFNMSPKIAGHPSTNHAQNQAKTKHFKVPTSCSTLRIISVWEQYTIFCKNWLYHWNSLIFLPKKCRVCFICQKDMEMGKSTKKRQMAYCKV